MWLLCQGGWLSDCRESSSEWKRCANHVPGMTTEIHEKQKSMDIFPVQTRALSHVKSNSRGTTTFRWFLAVPHMSLRSLRNRRLAIHSRKAGGDIL